MIADRECNYVCGALITFAGRRRQSPEPRTERVSSSSEELTFYAFYSNTRRHEYQKRSTTTYRYIMTKYCIIGQRARPRARDILVIRTTSGYDADDTISCKCFRA